MCRRWSRAEIARVDKRKKWSTIAIMGKGKIGGTNYNFGLPFLELDSKHRKFFFNSLENTSPKILFFSDKTLDITLLYVTESDDRYHKSPST